MPDASQQEALEMAYNAGKAASSDSRALEAGVDACPFPGGPERVQWLQGFSDEVKKKPDVSAIDQALKEAKGGKD